MKSEEWGVKSEEWCELRSLLRPTQVFLRLLLDCSVSVSDLYRRWYGLGTGNEQRMHGVP